MKINQLEIMKGFLSFSFLDMLNNKGGGGTKNCLLQNNIDEGEEGIYIKHS